MPGSLASLSFALETFICSLWYCDVTQALAMLRSIRETDRCSKAKQKDKLSRALGDKMMNGAGMLAAAHSAKRDRS